MYDIGLYSGGIWLYCGIGLYGGGIGLYGDGDGEFLNTLFEEGKCRYFYIKHIHCFLFCRVPAL